MQLKVTAGKFNHPFVEPLSFLNFIRQLLQVVVQYLHHLRIELFLYLAVVDQKGRDQLAFGTIDGYFEEIYFVGERLRAKHGLERDVLEGEFAFREVGCANFEHLAEAIDDASALGDNFIGDGPQRVANLAFHLPVGLPNHLFFLRQLQNPLLNQSQLFLEITIVSLTTSISLMFLVHVVDELDISE